MLFLWPSPSVGIDYDHRIRAIIEMFGRENYVCKLGTINLNELETKI